MTVGPEYVPSDESEHHFELVYRIGVALSSERDRGRLVERILLEAKRLCHADGGTLYLVENDTLRFAMIHTDSLGVAQGGSTGNPIAVPPIALYSQDRTPLRSSVATRAFHDRKAVHVPDAYAASGFDQSGFRAFDHAQRYRSVSILAIPLKNSSGAVIGVLQLVNARERETQDPIAFAPALQRTVEALAAQAGIALENQALLEGQRNLLDAFIRLIAEAIDAKSPYTGGHCERVPVLTEMIIRSLCEETEGPFAAFGLNEEEWRELRVAAWLHDCGKVTTPVHVMDKATKLQTIHDRIEMVAARFEVLKRDVEIARWRSVANGESQQEAEQVARVALAELDDELEFLRQVNIGSEFLSETDKERVRRIGKRTWVQNGDLTPVLEPDLVDNLCISRGTLSEQERVVINGHMVQTASMLESLPFPPSLSRVPEYACGHHERMDGKGYPRGLFAGDLSIPARVLAIADVFEALTASDRPYKPGKTLTECGQILAQMKRHNHLDPDLLDHCVQSGVLQAYAERYLPSKQIDAWDGEEVLTAHPLQFEPPPREVRDQRRQRFLPEYQALRCRVNETESGK